MLKFSLKLIFSIALCWGAYAFIERFIPGFGGFGILAAAPIVTRLFPKDVIAFFAWLKHRADHDALGKWQGRYYSFDDQQIRFFLHDDIVWLALPDLERILEPDLETRELRLLGDEKIYIEAHRLHAVSESGLLQLLRTRTETRHATHKMIRFKKWLVTSGIINVKRLPRSAIDPTKAAK